MALGPKPGSVRLGPLLAVVAGIGLMTVILQWSQVDPTTSGPESTADLPIIAAPVTTTTVPQTTLPVTSSSTLPQRSTTTTIPPPRGPGPVRVDTALGPMVWQRFEVESPMSTDFYSATSGLRADGTMVLLFGNENELVMLESATGEDWEVLPVSGFEPGVFPWRLVGDDMLMTTTWSYPSPGVWYEESPGRWQQSDIEIPELPDFWLAPNWTMPTIVSTDDGIDLFGGYNGRTIDWPALLDLPVVPEEYWFWEPGTRHLVVYGESGSEIRYGADVSVEGDRLLVTVSDLETGQTIIDTSAETPEATAILDALQESHHEAPFGQFTAVRWHSADGREFRIVSSEPRPGGRTFFENDLIHTEHGYITVEMVWDDESGTEAHLLLSEDAVTWEDITSRLGESPEELYPIAARDGTVVVVSRSQGYYEISEQVTAQGIVTTMFVSDDLESWTARAFGSPGRSNLHEVAAGPAGWIVTGDDCTTTCTERLWVSGDARTWTTVDLPTRRIGGNPFVGEDKMALLNYPEIEFERHVVWVGTLDDEA